MGGNVITAFSLAAALAMIRGDFSLEGFAQAAQDLNIALRRHRKLPQAAKISSGAWTGSAAALSQIR